MLLCGVALPAEGRPTFSGRSGCPFIGRSKNISKDKIKTKTIEWKDALGQSPRLAELVRRQVLTPTFRSGHSGYLVGTI